MRELIFVDTETTGLDADNDQLVELTWATRTSEPETLWFGVKEVPEFIDELIGFTKRGISGRRSDYFEIKRFLNSSDGNIMVAANPAHDKAFINNAGLWRFHYRMLDIESFAMAKLGLGEVPGMQSIYDTLKGDGADWLTRPDHTSRNDVLAMRECYEILEKL